jgi:hypothetical protein
MDEHYVAWFDEGEHGRGMTVRRWPDFWEIVVYDLDGEEDTFVDGTGEGESYEEAMDAALKDYANNAATKASSAEEVE